MMYGFKVAMCTKQGRHPWGDCPYAHPTENARRRDPRAFSYSCVECPAYRCAPLATVLVPSCRCLLNNLIHQLHTCTARLQHIAKQRLSACAVTIPQPQCSCHFHHTCRAPSVLDLRAATAASAARAMPASTRMASSRLVCTQTASAPCPARTAAAVAARFASSGTTRRSGGSQVGCRTRGRSWRRRWALPQWTSTSTQCALVCIQLAARFWRSQLFSSACVTGVWLLRVLAVPSVCRLACEENAKLQHAATEARCGVQ